MVRVGRIGTQHYAVPSPFDATLKSGAFRYADFVSVRTCDVLSGSPENEVRPPVRWMP